MSIQACMPSGCKSQHSVKATSKGPIFLRHNSSNGRQNAVNRRSAVERLEESKANYVKSECVLDVKQEFKNSSHLHVSTGPQLDIKLKTTPKHSPEFNYATISFDARLSGPKNCLQQRNPLPHKSPPPPLTRVRAKSQSETRDTTIRRNLSFASRGSHQRIGSLVDVESQLKRLIYAGSKENIISTPENFHSNPIRGLPEAQVVPKVYKTPELPKVRRGYSDPTHKGGGWDVSDGEQTRFTIAHKSLPDLSPPFSIPSIQAKSFCSDNSDDSIFQNYVPVVISRTAVQCLQPRTQSPVRQTDGSSELRTFSNGTGTLHLTPYCPQSNPYRRPVIRSKSDVSHRYTKRNSEYFAKRNNNYTNAEIERFFDTMGLDTTVWHHITSPSSISSPPCFFNSASSIDSNDRSSTYSEESSSLVPSKDGIRNFDLKSHGPLETSIVEKNARVIKWLYNCRKATTES